MLMEGRHVLGKDTCMKFVKPGSVSTEFCLPLGGYDKSQNKIKFFETERCALHEQRLHVTHDFVLERNAVSTSLLIRGEGEKEKEIWVANVVLLLSCVVGAV